MLNRIVAVVGVVGLLGAGCSSMMGATQPTSQAFNQEAAFETEGVLLKVKQGEVQMARPGLPPITLTVVERTKVTLDGQPRTISAIPEGSEVRASFQMVEDTPYAVELNATSKMLKE